MVRARTALETVGVGRFAAAPYDSSAAQVARGQASGRVVEPSVCGLAIRRESMRPVRILAVLVAGVLLLTLSVGSVGAVGGRPFTTELLGANEFPITGDPDATGTAHIWINQGQGTVCWSIEVANVDPIFAAHIHLAPA